MPPVKEGKRKISSLTVPDNVSFQDHVRISGENLNRQHIRTEMKDALDTGGSWGNVMKSMKIPLGDEEYEWHYLHPCALLSEACKRQPSFGDLVKGMGGPRLCVYMDEIKPGNILHPDPSRQVACSYWTLMNLPTWFHARKQGWFYLASFPTKFLKKLMVTPTCWVECSKFF